MQLRKLTFQEAWNSSTIFFVDEELENEIDEKVSELLGLSQNPHISVTKERTLEDIVAFLHEKPDGLDVILRDIGLSDEKFMRVISLLRKIGRISGGFDSEWDIDRVNRFINVDIDFAVPTLQDPWVIIMSSFQETTSSGQTTKARDMRAAYTRINDSNSRFSESRVFVNFVDGGGWLARKRDLERLVDECHYFINLQNLDMLEAIVLAHIPKSYISR